MSINPIKVYGEWKEGYALDYHTLSSTYIGDNDYGHPMYDTERSKIGQLVYEFKYNKDKNKVSDIIKLIKPFLNDWNIKKKVDAILPIPPSNLSRSFQPVFELANGISNYLDLPTSNDVLFKNSSVESKNLDVASKQEFISGSIIKKKTFIRKVNILLVDDLYKTGETLNEAVRVLKNDKNVEDIYVLTMTKTRR